MTTYSHRDFWTEGHGAKGLDRSILNIDDHIVYDNGKTIPAFAVSTYGPQTKPHGPWREFTDDQKALIAHWARNPNRTRVFHSQDSDGTLWFRTYFIGYAPAVYRVTVDGRSARVDAPYGDGTRPHSELASA